MKVFRDTKLKGVISKKKALELFDKYSNKMTMCWVCYRHKYHIHMWISDMNDLYIGNYTALSFEILDGEFEEI